MAKRIFLHVGCPKTGTTYLQSLLWANRSTLKDHGLLLPLERVRDHYLLSLIARDETTEIDRLPPRGQAAWERMLDEVASWEGDALISHELFARALPDRAEWTIDQLRSVGDQIHPIVTARDFARQLPAEWQQRVKSGHTDTLGEFIVRAQTEPEDLDSFWRVQDVPILMQTWSQGLPLDQVHLVTVPPVGAPRDLLWKRYASVLGVDATSINQTDTRTNDSLGVVEVETLRRVLLHPPSAEAPPRPLMIREVLAEGILANRPGAQKFAYPPASHPWVLETAAAMVDALRAHPYDIVGDLAELLPSGAPPAGRNPDEVTDAEVAEVAVETISDLLYRSHEVESRGYVKQVQELKEQLAAHTRRVKELAAQLGKGQQTNGPEERPGWKQGARLVRDLTSGRKKDRP